MMLLVFLTTTSVLVVSSLGEQFCKRRICYFDSGAQYREKEETRIIPQDIDLDLCSYIIYNRAYLTDTGITPGNKLDESNNSIIGGYEKVTFLKNDNTKVLLALRVKPTESKPFGIVTNNETSLREFAIHVIHFLRSRSFDGLDFQFVITGHDKTPPAIKNKISQVLEHLRQAFDEETSEASDSDRLLLTAAVYGEKVLNQDSFDVEVISQNVDWINLLALDFYGPWYGKTGHYAPLFPELNNTESHDTLYNVDEAVKHWVDGGAPTDKIVLGLPFYGRPFRLTSSATGVGAPATGGVKANYSRSTDYISAFEICELRHLEPYNLVYLKEQSVTYLVTGDVWISFDDLKIVRDKVKYIKENDLGGFAAYSINDDDVTGHFCELGTYPLLKAANMECNS